MTLIELKFENEQDYNRASVIHGTILQESGWKPNPETVTTMIISDAERAQELKLRLINEGIEFTEV